MDDKRIDLNLLLALEALLAEQNVTRAAKRLNLSQPALSAQLARLRDVFADPLLIPTSRGVLPTALALDLQEPLRQSLDQMRALVSRRRAFDSSTAQITFTIAASDYMQVAVLLPFLLRINADAPGIKIMVRLLDLRGVRQELERGEIDIAFVQSTETAGADLRGQSVLTERYVGVARKSALGGQPMTLERFIAARHIIVSPRAEGFQGPTDAALAAAGLTREVAFAVSSFVFLVEAVSRSDLIALAPARLIAQFERSVEIFEPPLAVPGFEVAMLWHDRTHAHPARAWLRDQLAAFCAEH